MNECIKRSAFFFRSVFFLNYLKGFGFQNKEKMMREGKETKSTGKERHGRKIINLAYKKNIITFNCSEKNNNNMAHTYKCI